ncbi:MAG: ATP-binding protein, partial [Chloroflexales bacterium]|nr:ATP-binding protein [Chloroflexales bacterium]
MTARSTKENPYLGPRAFSEDEREQRLFFGRDREREQLLDLLIARRLVLLHAPSGAGKTSLIQAGIIPRLRAEGFTVRNTVRVNTAIPPEVAVLAPNRFLLATLLALDEDLPA